MWKGGWDQCRVLDRTPVCAAEGFGGKAPRVSGPTLHAPPFSPPPPTSMEGEWGEVSRHISCAGTRTLSRCMRRPRGLFWEPEPAVGGCSPDV